MYKVRSRRKDQSSEREREREHAGLNLAQLPAYICIQHGGRPVGHNTRSAGHGTFHAVHGRRWLLSCAEQDMRGAERSAVTQRPGARFNPAPVPPSSCSSWLILITHGAGVLAHGQTHCGARCEGPLGTRSASSRPHRRARPMPPYPWASDMRS